MSPISIVSAASASLAPVTSIQKAADFVRYWELGEGENRIIKNYDIGQTVLHWLENKRMEIPCTSSDFKYDLGIIFIGSEQFILLTAKFEDNYRLQLAIGMDGGIKGIFDDNKIKVKQGKNARLKKHQVEVMQQFLAKHLFEKSNGNLPPGSTSTTMGNIKP